MSAEEALCHPFFTASISKEIAQKGASIDTDTKINAFRSFVGNLRLQNRGMLIYVLFLLFTKKIQLQ